MKTDLRKSVIYQIYLRTFTAEGTLKAAEKMLPHLYDLGIDIIYLSACNKEDPSEQGQSPRQIASGMNNPKNPYRIIDFFDVDEEYGTLQDMKDFICTAHTYGMKVLVDLVYLHCGSQAVFLEEHPEFVIRDEAGEILIGESWPFARFDFEVEALREYLWSNMEFYIREMDADGFRCDVADKVPLSFWREGVRRIREINPFVIMINEGSGPSKLEVFDANYMVPLIWGINNTFLNPENALKAQSCALTKAQKMDMTAVDLKELISSVYARIPEGKFTLCNAENHDTVSDMGMERTEMHLGSDAAEAIMTLIFTMKGIPMIYNGCEVADELEKNMFWNRFSKGSMSVQWQNALLPKGQRRLRVVKELIRLHRFHDAVCTGDFVWIDHDCEENVLCYKRECEKSGIYVMINVTAKEQIVHASEAKGSKVLMLNKAVIKEDCVVLAPYGTIVVEK